MLNGISLVFSRLTAIFLSSSSSSSLRRSSWQSRRTHPRDYARGLVLHCGITQSNCSARLRANYAFNCGFVFAAGNIDSRCGTLKMGAEHVGLQRLAAWGASRSRRPHLRTDITRLLTALRPVNNSNHKVNALLFF